MTDQLMKQLEGVTDATLALWTEIFENKWDDKTPKETRDLIEQELDIPSVTEVLESAIEEVKKHICRVAYIAESNGLDDLKTRIEEIVSLLP